MEVYRDAGLPAVTCPEELTSGEQRMLAERELDEFVEALYHPAAASARGRNADGRKGGGEVRQAVDTKE